MNASREMLKVATDVLAEAKRLDSRLEVDKATIAAWARCFEGAQVFPTEAVDAVHAHYRQKHSFPLMPGDVVSYCEAQPVWSSTEHASGFLDFWTRYPYSAAIEDYSGMRPPSPDVPDSVPPTEVRQWLIDRITEWVDENRVALVGAIMERRHKSVFA